MPELPEVACFTQLFNEHCLRKKIVDIQCKTVSIIYGASCMQLKKSLIGNRFKMAVRRGKFLIAPLSNSSHYLVFHFGMTGSLAYGKQSKLSAREKKYAQFIITFANSDQLLWINIRKLGKIYFIASADEIGTLKKMGPDALTLTQSEFLHILAANERKNIKALLMDQSIIAGIGNEYSNEILFQAGIDPHHAVKDLDKKRQIHLYLVMQKVLKKAVSLCGAFGKMPSTWLLAQKHKVCPKNKKHMLKKATIAGRSAWYCPEDQS